MVLPLPVPGEEGQDRKSVFFGPSDLFCPLRRRREEQNKKCNKASKTE